MPPIPSMVAPVGKSGPFTCFIRSSVVALGLSMSATVASIISTRLCGGIFVAIPTAIPSDPLTKRLGQTAGSTVGSSIVSSKFGCQSTVSFSRSLSISAPKRAIRASVYLIAAALSPSTDPKFP